MPEGVTYSDPFRPSEVRQNQVCTDPGVGLLRPKHSPASLTREGSDIGASQIVGHGFDDRSEYLDGVGGSRT
jgi:hypothetical protein